MDVFIILVNDNVDSVKFTEVEADGVYNEREAENSFDDICIIKVQGIITRETP